MSGWFRSTCGGWSVALIVSGCDPAAQDGQRAVQERLLEYRADKPTDIHVVRIGDHGGVSAADFEQMWREHPTWTREQVVEASIRQELLWRQWEGGELEEEQWKSLQFALKRGAVNVWIEREGVLDVEGADEATLAMDVTRHVAMRSTPAGYVASHMLVRVPEGADAAREDAAREATEELLKRFDGDREQVSAGALLRELARLENEEINGFEVLVNANMKFPLQGQPQEALPEGWYNVVEPFAKGAQDVVAAHGFGALSEPVKTSFGWHLIVVHERVAMREPDREEVAKILRRQDRDSKIQQRVMLRLSELYKEYTWSSDPAALEDDLDTVRDDKNEDNPPGEQKP